MEWLLQKIRAAMSILYLPTADQMLQQHLEDTKRKLLMAYAYKEHADSQVEKYERRLSRLQSQPLSRRTAKR